MVMAVGIACPIFVLMIPLIAGVQCRDLSLKVCVSGVSLCIELILCYIIIILLGIRTTTGWNFFFAAMFDLELADTSTRNSFSN